MRMAVVDPAEVAVVDLAEVAVVDLAEVAVVDPAEVVVVDPAEVAVVDPAEVAVVDPGGGGEPPTGVPSQAEEARAVFTLDFPHFANGDGHTSDLVFVNVEIHPIRPALYFYDKEGHLIAPESVVDPTEDLEVMEDGSLSIRTKIEPLGELTIATHGQEELVTGSVKVIAFGPIGGVLRFDLPEMSMAGVGASPPVRDALLPRCAVRREESTPGLRSTTWAKKQWG